jgi:hypothetical protein
MAFLHNLRPRFQSFFSFNLPASPAEPAQRPTVSERKERQQIEEIA